MNKIKQLRQQIKNCSADFDKEFVVYHQSKQAIVESDPKTMMPWLCVAAFGFGFSCAYSSKFRNQVLNVGKELSKTGLDNFSLFLPLLLKK